MPLPMISTSTGALATSGTALNIQRRREEDVLPGSCCGRTPLQWRSRPGCRAESHRPLPSPWGSGCRAGPRAWRTGSRQRPMAWARSGCSMIEDHDDGPPHQDEAADAERGRNPGAATARRCRAAAHARYSGSAAMDIPGRRRMDGTGSNFELLHCASRDTRRMKCRPAKRGPFGKRRGTGFAGPPVLPP